LKTMQGENVMAEKTISAPSGQETDGNAEITRAQERYIPPPVDIYEAPGELVLLADLPGVSKENLELHVDDGTLTIQAKAEDNVPGEPIYREFELSGFFRQFELSDEIDTEKTCEVDVSRAGATYRMDSCGSSCQRRSTRKRTG
jgi:HSP20 family protein